MKYSWFLICLAAILVVGVVGKPQHRHEMSPVLNGTSTEDNDDLVSILPTSFIMTISPKI